MRVVAGRLGGRALKAPAGDATRPTGARVKEALFSILGDLRGSRVLDLYAGSGALGIEALSRGAERAVFVENARPALACLRENLARLGLEGQAHVVAARVAEARRELESRGPFDLVLCDPPWREVDRAFEELQALAARGLLARGGRLVLEHDAKAPPRVDEGRDAGARALVQVDRRRWGDTAITFFHLRTGPADVPGALGA